MNHQKSEKAMFLFGNTLFVIDSFPKNISVLRGCVFGLILKIRNTSFLSFNKTFFSKCTWLFLSNLKSLIISYKSSSDFDLHEYRHYYLAENWKISKRVRKTHQLSPSKFPFLKNPQFHLHFPVASNMFMPRLFDQTPPSYLKWARLFLSKSDNGSQLSPFPYIASVTNRIVLCTKVNKNE